MNLKLKLHLCILLYKITSSWQLGSQTAIQEFLAAHFMQNTYPMLPAVLLFYNVRYHLKSSVGGGCPKLVQ